VAEIRWERRSDWEEIGTCAGCGARWCYVCTPEYRAHLEQHHRCPVPVAVPEAPGFQVTKAEAERYTIRAKEGFAWAIVTIAEDIGLLQVVSDYGSWSYCWGASGLGRRFKEFLLGVGQDYLVRKFCGGEREYLPDETEKEIRREILRRRREGGLTREQAREARDAVEEAEGWGRFRDRHTACDELLTNVVYAPLFGGDVHNLDGVIRDCLPRACCQFYDELFAGVLVPVLRAELGLAAPAQEAVRAA
jgi:hypothetical protein